MKALVKKEATTGIWMDDVSEPQIGIDDVLIKIRKTAICGTDIHIYNWEDWVRAAVPVPMTLGHEFVGEIADLGANVAGLAVGDRVSGEGHVVCHICRNCRAGKYHLCRNTKGVGVGRPGAFAEYLAIPASNVYKVPDDIADDYAAIYDPFGNATHTALSFDLVGEDVLITGAGPIGIMAGAIARHVGARYVVITDLNDYRLDLARGMGLEHTVNIARENIEEKFRSLGMQEGFDVGMEMSGVGNALNELLSWMNPGGKVALLGIPPDGTGIKWTDVVFKSLTIKGIYGREMMETWYKMTALLQGGLDLGPIITHHFAIDDYQQGFDVMNSGQSGKVILEWEG
ncbi:MAG: L-threonine 3-dehydrogenase [Sphingomonadales bacterium]